MAQGLTQFEKKYSRRVFLQLALVGSLPVWSLARTLLASDFNRFRVAQMTTGGLPPARPNAALVLAQEVRERTAVRVRLDRVVVPLSAEGIFSYPFLLWVGEGPIPPLDKSELKNLKAFLGAGGFILVDNAGEGPKALAFDKTFRAELRGALPTFSLQPVPENHVIMRSFYRVSSVAGRHATFKEVEAIFLEDRLALLYSRNDLAGAWSRDGFGNWEFEAVPGGPAQRESAIRFGVNIVMYALLLNYKDEQAHVEYLLKKRKLRPEDLRQEK